MIVDPGKSKVGTFGESRIPSLLICQLDQSTLIVTFNNMIMYKSPLFLALSLLISMTSSALAEGDREYGEYLSAECVTCHQSKDTEAKIPVINGMHGEGFIALMKAYRAEELDNPTMRTIAKRLTDEDIAALAAYYASLPAPE